MEAMCRMAAAVGVVAALLRAAPGAGWVVEDVHDGTGGRIETAVLEGGLAVLETRSAQIQMWRRAPGGWAGETVADVAPSAPMGFAVHPHTGNPYVAYAHEGAVHLAHFDSGHWHSQEVFAGDVEKGVSLAFAPDGSPAIAVAGDDGFTGALTYVWHDGGDWRSDPIATNHGGFTHPSLAFDPTSGLPSISYGQLFQGVGIAEFSGESWSTRLIDAFSFPDQTELRFLPGAAEPAIAYEDTWTDTLRLAVRTGETWEIRDVETGEWGNTAIGVFHDFGMDVIDDDVVCISWTRGLIPDAVRLTRFDGSLHHSIVTSEYRTTSSSLVAIDDSLAIAFNNDWTGKLRAATPEPATLGLLAVGALALMRRPRDGRASR